MFKVVNNSLTTEVKKIEKLTGREKEVLELIKGDATISREEIAAALEISESAVGTYIHYLSNKGYLLGRGYITAPEKKVVVIGGANLDIKGYSPNYIEGSSSPGWIKESSGGVGRNIAADMSLLGEDVLLLTAVSSDHFGHKIKEESKEAGIDISHFKIMPENEYKTGVYLAHLNQDGDLIGAVSDMRILKQINAEYLQEKRKIIENSAQLIFDTNLEEKVISELLELAETAETIIIADAVSVEKSLKLKGKLDKIDYLRSNLDEAEVLLGIIGIKDGAKTKKETITKRIKRVLNHYQKNKMLPQMVISTGKNGAYYFGRDKDKLKFEHFNSQKLKDSEIIETTGAGDALTAGFAAGIINDKGIKKAVELGIKAAVLTVKSELTCNPELVNLK